LLKKVFLSKAKEKNNIHPRLIKEFRVYVEDQLKGLTQSLKLRKVPDDSKRADATSMQRKKKKKKESHSNTPISLASVVLKLIKGFINNSIFEYLSKENFFNWLSRALGGKYSLRQIRRTSIKTPNQLLSYQVLRSEILFG